MSIRVGFETGKTLPLIVVVCLLGASTPAGAQIYTWRDDKGTLVMSNKPKPGTVPAVQPLAVRKADIVPTHGFLMSSRRQMYDDLIHENARLHNIRPDLVKAVVQVESAFNPYAESPKGALGLMQLMPATARQFGVTNAFNPIENVRAGVAYLRQLLDRYDDNEQLALAAYNAGPGAVDKYGEAVPPYRETQNYVSKIKDLAGARPRIPPTTIYEVSEVVNGRTIVRYTNKKPK
jgi:soluble lytic murein transglycosylase-like protein